ncbi:hypothetical protein MKZ38_007959 [Zalerion maritima]|uniref:6-phosphogluconolactonase n=1 Tax=Zalerion maritima TaxID=339359 RepID=A0AAD5RI00_9PEZI|nr:hypothetical protein MKZ38_007959 [Zalerion maritima]
MRLTKVISLVAATSLASASTIAPRNNKYHRHDKRAIYFLDNSPNGTSIVSVPVEKDGTLSSSSDAVRTPTGELGLFSVDSNGVAPMADTLVSQSSLLVSGDFLFNVNPGSNSISLFSIPPRAPTHPILLSSATVAGEFPNSLAYSSSLNLVCAVSTGAKTGVSCFRVSRRGKKLVPAVDLAIPFPTNQTTPPVGPPSTASHILFSPDDRSLILTIKGDGATPGYFVSYPISAESGAPEEDKMATSRPGEVAINFSLSFLTPSSAGAVVTDPSRGGALISFSRNNDSTAVTVDAAIDVANQTATCWSQYSEKLGQVYMLDGGSPDVILVSPETGEVEGFIEGDENAAGLFDAIIGGGAEKGEFLYVLQATAGISVFELGGGYGCQADGKGREPQLVQSVDLGALGSRQGWMGMGYYPN